MKLWRDGELTPELISELLSISNELQTLKEDIQALEENYSNNDDALRQDISGKLDKSVYDIDKENFVLKNEISDFITDSDLSKKGYLTSIPEHIHEQYLTSIDLNNYALKTDLPTNYINSEEFNESIISLESAINSKLASKVDENSVYTKGFVYNKNESDERYQEKGEYALKNEIPSLDGYAKENQLFSKNYEDLINKPAIPSTVAEFSDSDDYATKTFVTEEILKINQGEIPELNLDGYAKTEDIPTKVSQLENDENYLKELPEHTHEEYLTEHQDISGKLDKSVYDADKNTFALKTELFSKSYNDLTDKPEIPSLDGYATQEWVEDKKYLTSIPEHDHEQYLTEHQSLDALETKADASQKLLDAKKYTDDKLAELVDGAPEALNTIKEVGAALNEQNDVILALETTIGSKANANDVYDKVTSDSKYALKNDIPDTSNIPELQNKINILERENKELKSLVDYLNFKISNDLVLELNNNTYNVTGLKDETLKYVTIPSNVYGTPITSITGKLGENLEYLDIPTTGDFVINGKILDAKNTLKVLKIKNAKSLVIEGEESRELDTFGTTYINANSFKNYKLLQTVELPDSLEVIPTTCFFDCSSLKNIKLPSNLKSIEFGAFANCHLDNIDLPIGLEKIGRGVFLATEDIDGSGNHYFLKNLYIPSTVNNIGNTFTDTQTDIIIDPENKSYMMKDNCLIDIKDKNNKKIIWIKNTQTELPTDLDITEINSNSGFFNNATNLIIPKNIKNIHSAAYNAALNITSLLFESESQLENIGFSAFGMSQIKEIIIPNSVKYLGLAYGNELEEGFEVSEDDLYNDQPVFSRNLESITFEENSNLEIIGNYAFSDTKIKEINIPSSVLEIKEGAFQSSSLETVFINSNVILAENAFIYCDNLVNIYISEEENSISGAPWGATNATVHWNYQL